MLYGFNTFINIILYNSDFYKLKNEVGIDNNQEIIKQHSFNSKKIIQ